MRDHAWCLLKREAARRPGHGPVPLDVTGFAAHWFAVHWFEPSGKSFATTSGPLVAARVLVYGLSRVPSQCEAEGQRRRPGGDREQ